MNPTDSQTLAHARWLRQLKWSWAFFLISILSAGLCVYAPLVGMGRRLARTNLSQSIAGLRSLQPAPLNEDENAALIWQRAGAALAPWDEKKKKDDPLGEDADWRSEKSYAPDGPARTHLARNEAALKLADQAAAMGHVNWKLDYEAGISVKLTHLAPLRGLARLSALRARIAAYDHNWELVEKGFQTAEQAGAAAGSDQPIVCTLVRIAADRIVLKCLEDCLAVPGVRVNPRILGRLKEFAAQRSAVRLPVFEALKYEELSGLKMMDLCGSGEISMEQLSGPPEKTPFIVSQYSLLYPFDHGLFERTLQQIQDEAVNPPPGFEAALIGRCEAIGAYANRHKLIVTSLMLPTLGRAPTAEIQRQQEWRMAVIALSALEHRWRNHGAFPAALGDLGLDAAALANPFSEKYAAVQSQIAPDGAFWVWLQCSGEAGDGGAVQPREFTPPWALKQWRLNRIAFRMPPLDAETAPEP